MFGVEKIQFRKGQVLYITRVFFFFFSCGDQSDKKEGGPSVAGGVAEDQELLDLKQQNLNGLNKK